LVLSEIKTLRKTEKKVSKGEKQKFSQGLKTKDNLESIQEMTITKISVQNLTKHCTEK